MSTSLGLSVSPFLLVSILLSVRYASADLIELRSGEIFTGLQVQSYDASRRMFWIAKEGKKVRIPADQVYAIDFDSSALTEDVVGPEGAPEGEPVHRYEGESGAFLIRRESRLEPVAFSALRFRRAPAVANGSGPGESQTQGAAPIRNATAPLAPQRPLSEPPKAIREEPSSERLSAASGPLPDQAPLAPVAGVLPQWSDDSLYSNIKTAAEAPSPASAPAPSTPQAVKYIARWKGQGATSGSNQTASTPSAGSKPKIAAAPVSKRERPRRESRVSNRDRPESDRTSRGSARDSEEKESSTRNSRSSRSSRSRSSQGRSSSESVGSEYSNGSGGSGYSEGNNDSNGGNGYSGSGY